MDEGLVVKGLGGFYFVKKSDGSLIRCKARGRFKKENINIFVGDKVKIIRTIDNTWVIEEIMPRTNFIIRPPVANIDQCIIVFAVKNPDLNYSQLNRFLILAEKSNVEIVICLNKIDLAEEREVKEIERKYLNIGYEVLTLSAKKKSGIENLKTVLKDKISVVSGPSGVGKSTLLNAIQPGLKLATGDLSEKIKQGRHTTRHVELLQLDFGGLVADTPGFGYFKLEDITPEELSDLFIEINRAARYCRFKGCMHLHEPDCEIKRQVEHGLIYKERYDSYIELLREIDDNRRGL
ncbi:MAG TPA: ribosome small subunit-dependent GTPase A [Thermoanaerobacterales bacterium]|nr:ribosome small subunit-dependent GTPase A [Thermoanaerobacterales bacterium]